MGHNGLNGTPYDPAVAMSGSVVSIDLTPTQVDRVVRGASSRDFISNLLRGLADGDAPRPTREMLADTPRLSRSLLLGLLVLAHFPSDGSPITVTEVASGLGMSASTTHRYITTLLAVGLVEQDPRTRRYRIPSGG
jgi:hypothetical protein